MTSLWFRVYHALLYLYPADLRRRDGREMERLFSDLVDAERHARGSVAASLHPRHRRQPGLPDARS